MHLHEELFSCWCLKNFRRALLLVLKCRITLPSPLTIFVLFFKPWSLLVRSVRQDLSRQFVVNHTKKVSWWRGVVVAITCSWLQTILDVLDNLEALRKSWLLVRRRWKKRVLLIYLRCVCFCFYFCIFVMRYNLHSKKTRAIIIDSRFCFFCSCVFFAVENFTSQQI